MFQTHIGGVEVEIDHLGEQVDCGLRGAGPEHAGAGLVHVAELMGCTPALLTDFVHIDQPGGGVAVVGSAQTIGMHVAAPHHAAHDMVAGVDAFPLPAQQALFHHNHAVVERDEFRPTFRATGAQGFQVEYPLAALAHDVQQLALGVSKQVLPDFLAVMVGEDAVDAAALNIHLDGGRCIGISITVVYIGVPLVGKLLTGSLSWGEGDSGFTAFRAEIANHQLNIGAGRALHGGLDCFSAFKIDTRGIFEAGVGADLQSAPHVVVGAVCLVGAGAVAGFQFAEVTIELGKIGVDGNWVSAEFRVIFLHAVVCRFCSFLLFGNCAAATIAGKRLPFAGKPGFCCGRLRTPEAEQQKH